MLIKIYKLFYFHMCKHGWKKNVINTIHIILAVRLEKCYDNHALKYLMVVITFYGVMYLTDKFPTI